MAGTTLVYSIGYVATLIIEGITTFTDLQEFVADVRTREGGLRAFLEDNKSDPEVIERIMADEPRS